MIDAEKLKRILGLKPLPEEGGFYVESYRSPQKVAGSRHAEGPNPEQNLSTAIYFLLTSDTFSAMHRLKSDEIYHFYLGDPVELMLLRPDGSGEAAIIGSDLEAGMRPQIVVPAGTWQGSILRAGGKFALLGTTVAPGFEFADCEFASRQRLLRDYPAFSAMIQKLTR